MADDTEQLIAGRYRLERSLGSGGMGQVWAAEDSLLGRTVAVKVVDLRGRGDEEALRARVMREARAAARIDDPGSVRVFDVGDEGHSVFIVMELVEAPTLADVVREQPLSPQRAADIGLDVLDGKQKGPPGPVVQATPWITDSDMKGVYDGPDGVMTLDAAAADLQPGTMLPLSPPWAKLELTDVLKPPVLN